jgi:sugar/nucleoside kinase (ribokinase family)
VGNVNLDIKTSAIAGGEGVLEDGETSVEEIYESLGGGAANTAVAAAQLGAEAHLCACVGADELGARIEAALRVFGVVPHLARKPVATGRSINLNWANGQRHFVSSLANNRALEPADIHLETLAASGCGSLLRADVWFSEAMLAGGNRRLLERARAAGMTTYLDINWDPEWSAAGDPARSAERCARLAEALPWVDCAHGNERELGRFTGCAEIQVSCRWLVERGCGEVVVHRGERGAASFTAREGWLEVPAVPVARMVAATGCGDVFAAAHMLLPEGARKERLREAARVAAEHLSGARVLIPRLG